MARGVSENSLAKAILTSFKCHYFVLMFMNIINACLNMSSPFLIHPLINFVKTGENAWAGTIDFWDTSKISWLKWLTKGDQYGLTLALLLVFTQGFGYIL